MTWCQRREQLLFLAGVVAVHAGYVKMIRWWTKPLVIYGLNPIFAFVGSEVVARIIYTLVKVSYGGKVVPLETAIYESAFASWLDPKNASLAFAVCIVLFWLGILAVLYRQKIFLKV